MVELTAVGLVPGGNRFRIYDEQYLKIDVHHRDCEYIGFGARDSANHGYAVRLSDGVLLQFPPGTKCEPDGEFVEPSKETRRPRK